VYYQIVWLLVSVKAIVISAAHEYFSLELICELAFVGRMGLAWELIVEDLNIEEKEYLKVISSQSFNPRQTSILFSIPVPIPNKTIMLIPCLSSLYLPSALFLSLPLLN
jgi:hypothetical protein